MDGDGGAHGMKASVVEGWTASRQEWWEGWEDDDLGRMDGKSEERDAKNRIRRKQWKKDLPMENVGRMMNKNVKQRKKKGRKERIEMFEEEELLETM